ncbi:hypothetical protein AL755_13760 [Arthrobacter sp. ERGS1:01]|nr:hypothetical protein AL755_13760 [Arthrobacter sp. ERGS1:01]
MLADQHLYQRLGLSCLERGDAGTDKTLKDFFEGDDTPSRRCPGPGVDGFPNMWGLMTGGHDDQVVFSISLGFAVCAVILAHRIPIGLDAKLEPVKWIHPWQDLDLD